MIDSLSALVVFHLFSPINKYVLSVRYMSRIGLSAGRQQVGQVPACMEVISSGRRQTVRQVLERKPGWGPGPRERQDVLEREGGGVSDEPA